MKLWTKITCLTFTITFKESTTDGVEDALAELGDEFTEEEVRLVRYQVLLKWRINSLIVGGAQSDQDLKNHTEKIEHRLFCLFNKKVRASL